jgi:hypothetical protein
LELELAKSEGGERKEAKSGGGELLKVKDG